MRRRTKATGLVLLAASVAPWVACRQIVDFPDPPPASQGNPRPQTFPPAPGLDAGVACGLPYGTEGCASCANTHCCKESMACSADAVCAPYARCVGLCNGDPTCRATCGVDPPPPASSQGSALAACLVAHCENECRLTCGSLASYGFLPSAASTCQDCVANTGGCDTARACFASADCDAFRRCLGIRTTLDGWQACERADDAGAALDITFIRSAVNLCTTECEFGGNWNCVGRVSWPNPKSKFVTFTVDVKGSAGLVSGEEVSICDATDFDCNRPKAGPEVTDGSGRVVFQLQNSGEPYLGLNGYFQLRSPEMKFVPSLFYWGAPVSESEVSFTDTNLVPNGHLPVRTPDEIQQKLDSIALTWDKANRGIVAVAVNDCTSTGAPGVQIAINPTDPGVKVFYGMSSTATATNGDALVYLINVPPGLVDVTAMPQGLGKPSSRYSVLVRAGWITALVMVPTP